MEVSGYVFILIDLCIMDAGFILGLCVLALFL